MTRSAHRTLPLYNLLKKGKNFEWTDECEAAFRSLKTTLTKPPILTRPDKGEPLFLYLAVGDRAVSAALVKETSEGQRPIYFTSKILQGPELRYQRLEKVGYALLGAARRVRHYFQAHPIICRTDLRLRQVLHKPDLAGRLVAWSIELSEHDIKYEPRTAIKSQVLADFIVELSDAGPEADAPVQWVIYVDRSSNKRGCGAGIVISASNGISIEQSLSFDFKATNNQAEYEACLTGLRTAYHLGAREVTICSDSQLVISQVKGEFQAKEDRKRTRLNSSHTDIYR